MRTKLPKIDGKTLKKWVEWLKKEGCGCCHQKIGDTANFEVDVCVGWHDYGDGPKEKGYANWKIAWKIGWQAFNNAMQCDLDVDFDMPYDKDFNVYDTLSEVGELRTMKEWNALAAEINRTAKEVFAFALEADKEDKDDEDEE